uniref:Uncharacterized protein n=1 Tax=Magnetospirillum gryphiswaldense TaxID=55518 RepID=A4U403_9PROT|nr:hypothetical protein MGR_1134 [Magnetospirillum gryphiswaldense MSR-1]
MAFPDDALEQGDRGQAHGADTQGGDEFGHEAAEGCDLHYKNLHLDGTRPQADE